jgi:hypothetical protein
MSVLEGRVNGMTWGWTGIRGTWATPEAADSMSKMLDVGVNWTAIAFAALQEHTYTTDIPFEDEPTITDDELRWAIREAKRLGFKVVLKPVVNVRDGAWRGHIAFFDWDVPGEPSWTEWFVSYRRFIMHFAAIAEAEGVEMLCIGCEMVQSDKRDVEWRALIAEVRGVYSGLVTYNCDKYQEDRLTWWDAVDIISSSGYYPTGKWEEQLDRIAPVVAKHGKPFFFMEAGCPSREGSAAAPNDWSLPGGPSEDEQANYYTEMFDACAKRDWAQGFMLWDWPARLYSEQEAATNTDYCPYGKKAAGVLRSYYT